MESRPSPEPSTGLSPRQKRVLYGLLPGPFLICGSLVYGELAPTLGWEGALAWALAGGVAATGAFAAVYLTRETRKNRKSGPEPEPTEPRRPRSARRS